METQLSMLVLEVRDLEASVAFYRDLGLEVPDPQPGRPLVIHRMGSGVSLLLTTSFAATYDPAWTRPAGGYQQLLEFYVGDDASVDRRWADLVAAGHPGRMPPTQTAGPYAAMVDDPDGNVVLLTSDEGARVDGAAPGTS
ncbi:VOC family protein [Terrabacter lapilli]|uniref:VOC family protein n=1 Tax=Terrabacter lapilli TaxID=436231 RepID=A0ABP5DSG7_9MICO